MAARLAACDLRPQLLLTSSAERAVSTTKLIQPALATPTTALRIDPRIYLASPGQILAVIEEQDDAIDSIVLVGHNPGLTQLSNMLVPELYLPNLPTAGAVAVECATEHWADISAAAYRLHHYDYPRNRAAGPI